MEAHEVSRGRMRRTKEFTGQAEVKQSKLINGATALPSPDRSWRAVVARLGVGTAIVVSTFSLISVGVWFYNYLKPRPNRSARKRHYTRDFHICNISNVEE